MIKWLFFFLLGLLSVQTAKAQNAALEAKAAYLLAEEEYNNGKYIDAIKYLDEAAAKLGKRNAKILYLQILSEAELAKFDTAYRTKLLQTIHAFQSTPDAAEFNEEKTLEVAKLKFKTQREQQDLANANKAAIELKQQQLELQKKQLLQASVKGIKIGMSENELFEQSAFSRKHSQKTKVQDTLRYQLLYAPSFWLAATQAHILADFKEGRLVQMQQRWFWQSTKNFNVPKDSLNKISILFGAPMSTATNTNVVPISNRAVDKNWKKNIVETVHTWSSADREITVSYKEITYLQKGQLAYNGLGAAEMLLTMRLIATGEGKY